MKRYGLLLAALAAMLVLVPVQVASAGNGNDKVPKGQTKVSVEPGSVAGESAVTTTLVTGDAVEASDAQLQQDGGLVGSNGMALADAATTAATIYYFTWWQRMESLLWGIAWNETHKGGVYFNGNAVWVRSRFGWDTSGYHRCGYHSGFGFSIDVQSCWKTGDPAFAGSGHLTNGDQFKVSAIVSGFPISATHEMRYCVWPSGYSNGC
jgi:hypothetical protein